MKHKHSELESLRKSPEAIAGKDYKFSCSSALPSSNEQEQGQPFPSGHVGCLLDAPLSWPEWLLKMRETQLD